MANTTTLVPNLGPDVDRAASVAATYIVGCTVSLLFVVLRFFARYRIHALAIDDWCMLVTWMPFLPLTVLTCELVFRGGTRHLHYLAAEDPANMAYLVKMNWIAQPFGILALGLGKVAVSLLLVRLLDRTSHWRKFLLHGLSIWTILNTIIMILLTFVQCRNPRALWDQELKASTKCWDPAVQSDFSIYGSSAFSFVDFVLAAMPLTLIWSLQLTAQKKIGLAILLCCGALTGACAVIKTSKLASLSSRSDLTWETYDLYIWTGVEIALLIVCGSIPTLKPLYTIARGKQKPNKLNSSYKSSTSSVTMVQTNSKHQIGAQRSQRQPLAMAVTKTFKTMTRAGSKEPILPTTVTAKPGASR